MRQVGDPLQIAEAGEEVGAFFEEIEAHPEFALVATMIPAVVRIEQEVV